MNFFCFIFVFMCGLLRAHSLYLVVTGSTDGIGKEYAKQLAQRGINIVLIARNESKLIQTSREIGKHFTHKHSVNEEKETRRWNYVRVDHWITNCKILDILELAN